MTNWLILIVIALFFVAGVVFMYIRSVEYELQNEDYEGRNED